MHALERYITQNRFIGSGGAGVVKKINREHSLGNSSYEDVAHEDVFDHATTPGVRLETQCPIEIGAIHAAIFDEDITTVSRDFTSYNHSAMSIFHGAAAHDYIFGRNMYASTVRVPPALNGDAVVARVEDAILNQHIAARLRIATIVVGAVTDYRDAAHSNVAGKHRMDFPHRRVNNPYPLDKDVLTTVGLYETISQVMAVAKHALLYRHTAIAQLAQSGYVSPGRWVAAGRCSARPLPPVIVGRRAIEHATASDRDVLLLKGVNERRVVHTFGSLEAGVNNRQVFRWIRAELQGSAFR